MSLVNRAPLTNYRNKAGKGKVRFISKKGISVTLDSNGRPVGLGQGMPDMHRSNKEVYPGDKGEFTGGKGVKRGSVYNIYNSGFASGWKGARSRTK